MSNSVPSLNVIVVFISISGDTDPINCLSGFESLASNAPESINSLTVFDPLSPLTDVI
jgi:hypothetical protein